MQVFIKIVLLPEWPAFLLLPPPSLPVMGGVPMGWASAVRSKTQCEGDCGSADRGAVICWSYWTPLDVCFLFTCREGGRVRFFARQKETLVGPECKYCSTAVDTFHAFINFMPLWLHELCKWPCCSSCYLWKPWAHDQSFGPRRDF